MLIYKITNNVNGKIYIGLTTESLQKRWNAHKAASRRKNAPLYMAMRKYGIDKFNIEQIDETDDISKLGELERYYINQYKTYRREYGYNQTMGGEKNQLDANPKAKLTMEDVINIRRLYEKSELTCKQAYELYKNKIKYGPFERCWEGRSWHSVLPEVFNDETKKKHALMKIKSGDTNGNAKYSREEVIEIRNYYKTHTFGETFEKYSKSKCKSSFNKMLKHEYKNIPLVERKPYERISKPRGPYKKIKKEDLV